MKILLFMLLQISIPDGTYYSKQEIEVTQNLIRVVKYYSDYTVYARREIQKRDSIIAYLRRRLKAKILKTDSLSYKHRIVK